MSYTYVIVDSDSHVRELGWTVKIGMSGDPEARLASLQTANPGRLMLLASIPGCGWEPLLHAMLSDFRLSGEWFKLDYGRIALLATIATEYDQCSVARCDYPLLAQLLVDGGLGDAANPCTLESIAYEEGIARRDFELAHESGLQVVA